MFVPPVTPADAFELHVALQDVEPPIWRRVRVPVVLMLGGLHEVLQIAFGWTDSHLLRRQARGADEAAARVTITYAERHTDVRLIG